jgi:ABC-type nitrate/sulfonate/bicarbonate transport system permease component
MSPRSSRESPAGGARAAREWAQDLWASWAGVLLVLAAWQLAVTFRMVNPAIFPGPVQVLQQAWINVPLLKLMEHIGYSLMRVTVGFGIGAGLGIAIGITSGWYRWLGMIVRAPIELLRPIPPLAWIPLALIWFGLGETSRVFMIALGAFFPAVTNTYKGMVSIDPELVRAAQTLGLRGAKLLTRVTLPAAMPDVATGVRIAWSLSFGSLVAAEILAADQGLGYLIMHARELAQIGVIIFGILVIGLVNLATDALIRELILKRQLKWHFGGFEAL